MKIGYVSTVEQNTVESYYPWQRQAKGIAVARQNGRYSSRKKLETDRNGLEVVYQIVSIEHTLKNKRALAKTFAEARMINGPARRYNHRQ